MAGAAANKLFLNPVEVKGNGKLGPTGVDHIAAATLKFENGIIGEIIAAVECSIGESCSYLRFRRRNHDSEPMAPLIPVSFRARTVASGYRLSINKDNR